MSHKHSTKAAAWLSKHAPVRPVRAVSFLQVGTGRRPARTCLSQPVVCTGGLCACSMISCDMQAEATAYGELAQLHVQGQNSRRASVWG